MAPMQQHNQNQRRNQKSGIGESDQQNGNAVNEDYN